MDVFDLQEFYADPLGGVARHLVSHRVRMRVTSVRDLSVLGFGYATPYLGAWRDEAQAIFALMPARQGVARWPRNAANLAGLVYDDALPLPDGCVDLALVAHELEFTENLSETLREIWRVLRPGGKMVAVVPNRRGLWAMRDLTPFGHGRPFSRTQLSKILRESMFDPVAWAYALHVPPFNRGFLRRSATWWERLGMWLWPGFGGVIIVEATKQVYATVEGKRERKLARRLRPALAPVPGA